jgi:ABC-type proline/glycine betaine transport system permease subunit
MSLTIAMMLVTFFLSGNHFSDITLQHALLLTGSTVLAGLCGKLLGLLWARWRLLRLAARLCNETILEQGHKLKTSI